MRWCTLVVLLVACSRKPRGGSDAATLPPCAPRGQQPTIYAHTSSDLYIVNPNGWRANRVGAFANGDRMTDLAVAPDGRLYGISFTTLYGVNRTTGKATRIADVPGTDNNGLTFLRDGTLLASDRAGDLKRIDPRTGAMTIIGNYEGGLASSGDLVAIADGTLFGVGATRRGFPEPGDIDRLLRVDPATGRAEVVGSIGFGTVWSLAYVNGNVIGFTSGGQIIQIDPRTGKGTSLAKQAIVWWGAAVSPLVPASTCP